MKETRDSTFVRNPRLAILGMVLILLLAGCQRPAFLDEELPDDGPPIATSPEAARRFVEKVTAAGQRAGDTKRVSLTVTQQEATSFLQIGGMLAEQMEAMSMTSLEDMQQLQGTEALEGIKGLEQWQQLLGNREGLPNISLSDLALRVVIRDPEVYFKGNGHLIVRGYAEVLGQRQPIRLVFAPRAVDGELVLDFVEGNVGPVEVPELLIDRVGKGLARAIMAGQDYVEVSQIQVGDGSLTISGRYVE